MSYQEIYNLTYPVILLTFITLSYFALIKIEFIQNFLVSRETFIEKVTLISCSFIGIAFISLACFYVIFPGYWDHAEASIVSLGIIFKNGEQLYPSLDTYNYNGILYGPFLSELHALFQYSQLQPILASKLPGFLAFILSTIILFKLFKNSTCRIYLLLLLIYGVLNFWTRTEPILILTVAISLLLVIKYDKLASYFILGLLGAIAFSIKFHAVFYVIAAITVVSKPLTIDKKKILIFLLSFTVGVIFIFSPPQINIENYLGYLHQASKHGISIVTLFGNLTFFVLINIPIISYLAIHANTRDFAYKKILFLLVVEFATGIIGSKPGAGIHHFMPFIPINAYVINALISNNQLNIHYVRSIHHLILLIMVLVVAPQTLQTYKSFLKDYSYFKSVGLEISEISKKYEGLVLGATDHDHYNLTFFRPLLESQMFRQIDYSAFMDYKLSNINDTSLVTAMKKCLIGFVILPNEGRPFSIRSYYDGQLLFSENIREAFDDNFFIVKKYRLFSVYECKV